MLNYEKFIMPLPDALSVLSLILLNLKQLQLKPEIYGKMDSFKNHAILWQLLFLYFLSQSCKLPRFVTKFEAF